MSKNKTYATTAQVNALLDVQLEDSAMEGFVFDPEVAKRAFDHFDKDKSNTLQKKEILKLAEKLWNTFYPQGPALDEDGRGLLAAEILKAVDEDGNAVISFDEFVPWFKRMNEKFWALTHPKPLLEVSPAGKAKKLGAGAPLPPQASSSVGGSPTAVPAVQTYGSDIDAPPAKADMEPIRARLEDLRSSIEAFGTMLDMRLDNWLQTIESYGDQIKGTQGSSGIV